MPLLILFLLLPGEPIQDTGDPVPRDDRADWGIERCLICHGKPLLTQLSPEGRRSLLRQHPEDADQPLKSQDPAFRARLHLERAGYLESAHYELKCVDCHRDVTLPSHRLGREPVNCVSCHEQQWNDYQHSAHRQAVVDGKENGADCYTCHGGYHDMLMRTHPDSPVHPDNAVATCGLCHQPQWETYQHTLHGVFNALGNKSAAVCVSCHENHRVLPAADPAASIHPNNRHDVCLGCHAEAGPRFAEFRPHLNALENKEETGLHATAWFMRILLIGVLGFVGLQTLLLFLRSLPDLAWRLKNRGTPGGYGARISLFHRLTHGALALSIFGLSLSGLPLLFPDHEMATRVMAWMGGLEGLRHLHRTAGILMFASVAAHLVFLARARNRTGDMLPRKSDFRDLWHQWRWFLCLGPRPRFQRFGYMEKFDYFAVFWGTLFMGLSGLILWFPEFFTEFLPGSIINAALIIHSEEAILAMVYIFALHFAHTHLRPLKFPVDTVIFTGRAPAAEMALERQEDTPPAGKVSGLVKGLAILAGLALLALGGLLLAWVGSGLF